MLVSVLDQQFLAWFEVQDDIVPSVLLEVEVAVVASLVHLRLCNWRLGRELLVNHVEIAWVLGLPVLEKMPEGVVR